jgi:hypothetical protein
VSYDPCSCIRTTEEENETVDLGDSEFLLNVKVVNEADVFLEGTSKGTLKPLEKDPGQSNGRDDWSSFYGPVKRVRSSIEAGKKAYKTFSSFKADAEQESDLATAGSAFEELAKSLTKETPALEMVPYVSEALAIVDFFVTGGKKEDATKIGPMAMNLEHSFSGEIRTGHDYILDNRIFTPGSEFTPDPVSTDPNRPLGDARYPYYNEILGVYTLLEKPEVKVWWGYLDTEWPETDELEAEYYQNSIYRKAVKITPGSIKIAVNPASGLTIRQAFVQLNYLLSKQGPRDSAAFYDAVEKLTYQGKSLSSQLIPFQNLDERVVFFDEVHMKDPRNYGDEDIDRSYQNGTLTTSLVIVFENNQGDQFLHKSTWDTEAERITPDSGNETWDWEDSEFTENGVLPSTSDQFPFPGGDYGFNLAPENLEFLSSPWRPVNNGTSKITFNNQVFPIPNPARLKAKNSIILKNIHTGGTGSTGSSPAFVWRFEDNFIAGSNITVENSTINPNTTLRISPLGITDPQPFNTMNIATAGEVNSICESSTYLGNKRVNYKKENYLQEKPVTKPQINFKTYPNPAQESVLIILENARSYPAQLEITLVDISGNLVQRSFINRIEFNGNKYRLNLQGIAPGMYVVKVGSGNIIGQRKIVKL